MSEFLYIKDIKIKKTAALAPMASVADRAYREMCKSFGAAYVVSEMISSKGLCFRDKKTAELCKIEDFERPMALQIFGEEPKYMGMAAAKLSKFSPDIIDINMGCPVPKIVGNGSGSALMKSPETAEKIAKAVVKNSDCPVTVKIRAGWDENSVNAVEFAKRLEHTGISAITVHARTRSQFYSGKADWEVIRRVKQAVKIPVIGNGDVASAQDCAKMYEQTGCDLVMIGRGSYGRPWIFEQVSEYLDNGGILPEPPIDERMKIMLRHGELLCKYKGERQGMKEMRKNLAWYVKGLPNAAKIRGESSNLNEFSDLKRIAKMIIDRKDF